MYRSAGVLMRLLAGCLRNCGLIRSIGQKLISPPKHPHKLGLTQPPAGTRGSPVLWFKMSGTTHPLSPPAFMALTGTTLPTSEMMSDRDEIFAHY
jgi:hypothetical protein